MKVIVTKREDKLFDVRIRRTRKAEGDSSGAKGLTRAELKAFVEENINKLYPVSMFNG